MEIIAHTAYNKKTEDTLIELLNNELYSKIELDFVFCGKTLYWSHDKLNNNGKKPLNIYDVLEITNHKKPLSIEFKGPYPKTNEQYMEFFCAMNYLNAYGDIQVQSFNQNLLRELLQYNFKNIEFGVIINIFKTILYRDEELLNKCDFFSLSRELWESLFVGREYKSYQNLFKKAKLYAWTWDCFFNETEKRIKNYIEKGADGIITSKPELVRKLSK